MSSWKSPIWAYKIGANELLVPVISLEDILEDFMPYSVGLVKL